VDAMHRLFINLSETANLVLERKIVITERTATIESLVTPALEVLRAIQFFFLAEDDEKHAERSIESIAAHGKTKSRSYKSNEIRTIHTLLLCRWD